MATSKISIKVIAHAARNKISAPLADGTLKLRVKSPREGGAANRAVERMLAQALRLPTMQVAITRGPRSPRKIVTIKGISQQELEARLGRVLPIQE